MGWVINIMEIPAQLIDWAGSLNIFKGNRKPIELKVKAFLLWLILSSCRKLLGFLSFGGNLPVNLNEWCLKFRAILEAKEWGKPKKP